MNPLLAFSILTNLVAIAVGVLAYFTGFRKLGVPLKEYVDAALIAYYIFLCIMVLVLILFIITRNK